MRDFDVLLDREMGYTDYQASCRAPHPHHEDVVCRRGINNHTEHAAGFGESRLRWPGTCDRFDFPLVPIVSTGRTLRGGHGG